MEQILIRNLPPGTKRALRSRAERHRRSLEAEAREILAEAVARQPATLVDLLATDADDVELESERLGVSGRVADLDEVVDVPADPATESHG